MGLTSLYKTATGMEPSSIVPITPAGSNRRYFRLDGPVAIVGIEGTSKAENDAFIYLARHFFHKGLPVPEIISVSEDGMEYLVSDLGDTSLFDNICDIELLEKAIRTLARLHCTGADGLDYSRCYPVEEFDDRAVLWDLNYFKYSFLNTSGISYDEPRLQDEFEKIASAVGDITRRHGTFMYRDFQSRNVMIKDNEPYLIDFQGGRKGPASYDLASFIHQARAGFSDDMRHHLTETYLDEARKYRTVDTAEFHRQLKLMSLVRSLQTLGAYGLRGRFERKSHFLLSIPPALAGLRNLIDRPFDEYPYLMDLLSRLTLPVEETSPFEGLTVRVTSFSFKKGIPDDPSGNGGGFVFDCRAMDNPGRYNQYKKLTGLDRPVIEFLEERGEITRFLRSCFALIDNAVANYMERGFTSLSVSYGCTGGQHRSVYSAEHTAGHVKEMFPGVRVILCHREQNITRTL